MLARETNRRWVDRERGHPGNRGRRPAGRPDDADPAETHTRIVVIQSEKDGENRPIVALANPTSDVEPARLEDSIQGILARELFRQALLIAARDELSLATRDEVLGDSIPPAAKDAKNVELATVFHITKGLANRAAVRNEKQGKYETLLKYELEGPQIQYGDLAKLCEVAEAHFTQTVSRGARAARRTGKPNVIRPDAGRPKGTEEKLSHLGFLEPFDAIRDLHRAIRTDGESPSDWGTRPRLREFWGF